MEVKRILKKVFHALLIFSMVMLLVNEISLPTDTFYSTVIALLFVVTLLIHEQILTFLTIRKVFITRLLTITLLMVALFYAFTIFIPDFTVTDFELKNISSQLVEVKGQKLDKYATIIVASLLSGLLFCFGKWLEGGDD